MPTSFARTAVTMLLVVVGLTLFAPGNASAAGVGQFCGGIAAIRCDRGLFCQFPSPFCGFFDRSGTCVRIPKVCPFIFRPVCGCDGKTYPNDCVRQRARVSKRHDGRCP